MKKPCITLRLKAAMTVMLIVFVSGCGRNTPEHDLSEMLIGHWKAVDGNADYYVTQSEITFHLHKQDQLSTHKYIVLQQCPNERTIELRVQMPGATDFTEINDRKVVFAENYNVAKVRAKIDLLKMIKKADTAKLLKFEQNIPPEYMSAEEWRRVDDDGVIPSVAPFTAAELSDYLDEYFEIESTVVADMRDLDAYTATGLKRARDFLGSIASERLPTWSKAAEFGIADGQYLYGVCLDEGLGVAADPVQAVAWIRKAAEQGNGFAQFDLGERYKWGNGVAADTSQSVSWIRKAAELGNASAQCYLGALYDLGNGVVKDPVQAVTWLRKAAEQWNCIAQYNLAVCYKTGRGVKRDSGQYVVWLTESAKQGFDVAQYYLAKCYDLGDGVEKDQTQSLAWLRKSAEQGLDCAQNGLGVSHLRGLDGLRMDSSEAVSWFRKAAEQGFSEAQYNLAWCYQEGNGVAKDPAQAVVWYQKAASQGYADAQYSLGLCYAVANGVEKDPIQAIVWWRKAAEQGDASAHCALAVCCAAGRGVVQDDKQACVHLLIAGALGEDTSKRVNDLRNVLPSASYATAQREANAWMGAFRADSKKDAEQTPEFMTARRADGLRGTGSGFIISTDGYFLTCAHVVEAARSIKVRLGTRTFPAQLVRTDAHNDVALLKLDGTDFRPLAFAQSLPEMGDKVFTVGFPNPELQGASAKYTDGAVSSLSGIMDDIRTMQITVPIQGGNSGGALVDADGNVLGLVVAQLNAATVFEYTGTIPQNVNFAVKIIYALPIVQSVAGLSRGLPPPRRHAPNARPVDVVKAATGMVLVYE